MASNYWIKLYHEILDDPKMGTMDDHLYRRTIEMMLLAGDAQMDGLLPNVTDMSWRLRTSEDDIVTTLEALEKMHIVHQEDDDWVLTNFSERQAKMSAAERMRRMRERKQKQHYYGDDTEQLHDSDASVTKRNAEENRREKNRIEEEEKANDAVIVNWSENDIAKIARAYERAFSPITPLIADELVDLASEADAHRLTLPPGAAGASDDGIAWVVAAIHEGGRTQDQKYRGRAQVNFITAIVRRWMQEGYKAPFRKGKGGASSTVLPDIDQVLAEQEAKR